MARSEYHVTRSGAPFTLPAASSQDSDGSKQKPNVGGVRRTTEFHACVEFRACAPTRRGNNFPIDKMRLGKF
jgi:hypothetical protein